MTSRPFWLRRVWTNGRLESNPTKTMKFTMGSWKTTSAGLLTILGAVVGLWFKRHSLDEATIMTALTAILGGIGLLMARDNDKSTEDIEAAKEARKDGNSILPLLAFLGIAALIAAIFVGCATADKAAATSTATAKTAVGAYIDYYHVSTNAHPERAAQMTADLTNVMRFGKDFGLASHNYLVISSMYQTNAALSNSASAAIITLNQSQSNLLWMVKYFRNRF